MRLGCLFLLWLSITYAGSVPAQEKSPAPKKGPKNAEEPSTPPENKTETKKEDATPQRFSIPKNATSATSPRTMMEIPPPSEEVKTASPAPEKKDVVLTDKDGKIVDNLLFGFMTASGAPLKDDKLKQKGRKAVAELLFGVAPSNAWWDSNNLLVVEGTPLKVVFVKSVNGKPVEFEEKKEEPAVEKQFADQVRAIFYQAQTRDLSKLVENKTVYFGLLKNGMAITNGTEEHALQQDVYRILKGEDVSGFETEASGVLRHEKDIIGLVFLYIDRKDGEVDVKEVEEPFKSQLIVGSRQHVRQVVIVMREAEKARIAKVASIKDSIHAAKAGVDKGRGKNQTIPEREGELVSAKKVIPTLVEQLNKVRRNKEGEEELKLAAEMLEKIEVEEEALLYPQKIAVAAACQGYELVREKRALWSLRYGDEKKTLVEWNTPPLWHNCEADLFVIAVGQAASGTASYWQTFQSGKEVWKEQIDPEVSVEPPTFFTEDGAPRSLRFTIKGQSHLVEELTPGGKSRLRILVGGEFDKISKFRFWVNNANEIELTSRQKGVDTSIRKFRYVDPKSFIGNSSHLVFSGTPEGDPKDKEKIYAVKDTQLTDLTAKLPAHKIVKTQWIENRKIFRFNLEGDQVNHYEINEADYAVNKRLSVSSECEKAFTFTVKADAPDRVLVESLDTPKRSLEVEKIRGIVCSGKKLALLAHNIQWTDKGLKAVGSAAEGQLVPEELSQPERVGSTLFVLRADGGVLGYAPLPGFVFSDLAPLGNDKGYQALLKGPAELNVTLTSDGTMQSPKRYASDDESLWVSSEKGSVLLIKGQWVVATSKLTAFSRHNAVISMVADDLKFSDGLNLPPNVSETSYAGKNRLLTIEESAVYPPFTAPLEAEGEVVESVQLVKRGGELWQRIRLKQNDDYGLLVNLAGDQLEAEKYRPLSGEAIRW